ncbi:MAG: histidinol dehydrogenase [Candidatus Acidiferrales bacterium]
MRVLPLTNAIEEKILARRRGRDRAAETIASRIIRDVQRRGDAALFAWTKRFDRVVLTRGNTWVSAQEMREASRRVSAEFLDAVDHAARNIRTVARRQKPQAWTIEVEPGVRASQRVQPIETVGLYIPGGRFSLVSTLLMTAIPAQEVGVRKIVIASPQPGDELLAAAAKLGLRHVARVGGAQAIAAFAYGTSTIPRVDKIFGPGNRYVTAAKRLVSGDCAIDLLAGPTEAIVFAQTGKPRFIAADLLAQSEHDPDAIALFVTTSSSFGRAVAAEIERQLSLLPKPNPAGRALAKNGAVLIARSPAQAVRFINRFAPEHLSLSGTAAVEFADRFDSAGSIFLGDWSAQSFGDYATGTNHVLPTGGVARSRGGLSTADFVKCISVQKVTRAGVARLAPVVRQFAKAEGLLAHGRSVEVRQ